MAIYEELELKRLELYKEYAKDRKKGNYSMAGFGLVLVIYVILIINNLDYGFVSFILIILGVLGLIFGGIYTSKASKTKRRFSKLVKDEFVDKILAENFETFKYIPDGYVDIATINKAGSIKYPDRYNGEDLIIGEYKDVSFRVSDIILTERQVVHTKNGTHVTYIDYFKGRWYVYNFDKKFDHSLKILERNNGADLRGYKKYETEMIEFNKKFNIYSTDEQFFYYIMNPFMIERLLLLEKAHRGTILYSLVDNELHIGINDNSDSLEINFNRAITRESIRQFSEDIELIKTIIEELRLYDVKFRK